MEIQRIEEFCMDPATRAKVQALLRRCFSQYPAGQTYFKQLPDFRFLGRQGSELVAHLAAEHRLVNNGGAPVRIFGVADLCVDPAYRRQGLATRLLQALEALGQAHEIDFLLLLAKDHGLYVSNGFQLVQNPCRWLMIQQHQTFGVAQRTIDQTLMVKALGDKSWRNGLVDFLGHIF